MKNVKLFIMLLFGIISSFFFINKVDALFKETTDTRVNSFTLVDKGNYVVIHKLMDLNGEYTIIDSPNDEGEELLGTVIEQDFRRSFPGFKQPDQQSIVIGFGTKTIEYLYEREKRVLNVGNNSYVTGTINGEAYNGEAIGEYYYGSEIVLMAAETDSNGNEFMKWSNGEVYPTVSITLTEDTTIRPIYGNPYIVEFRANGGSPAPASIDVNPGDSIGTLPVVTKDDCQLSEGSYSERNCTYAYEFKGWYKEPEFVHQVDANFVPTENTTLYAKWNKVYFHDDEETFDGNNFIDTEIALFSRENAYKNFIVTFTLDENDSAGIVQATLFGDINEKADPWPGTVIRYDKDHYEFVANVTSGQGMGKRMKQTINGYGEGQTYVIKRENGKLYYSVNGGQSFTLFNDFSSFTRYFDVTGTFGAEYDGSGNPYRYFKGKLSNMTVELSDRDSYTVKFDANGGEGTMADQKITVNESVALNANVYSRPTYSFSHWNTSADGSGTSYSNEQVVTDLAGKDETITLYAQWTSAPHYYIHFDANSGEGTMEDQEFIYDVPQKLNYGEFTKEGQAFDHWNTKPDGSGVSYRDGGSIINLSSEDQDVVTLYAQYRNLSYHNDGPIVFDGTNFIDANVNPYSRANLDKDFTIEFDIVDVDPANATSNVFQPTIISSKDEDNPVSGELVPGFVARLNKNNVSSITVTSWWGSEHKTTLDPSRTTIHVEITRRDGVVKMIYTYPNAAAKEFVLAIQDDWDVNLYSMSPITFGATYINGEPQRFFMGTLANIDIQIEE